MKIFWITLHTRTEKMETLKRIIEKLHISNEEKDLYIISLEILDESDFSHFSEKIFSQIQEDTTIYTIEPLTSKVI